MTACHVNYNVLLHSIGDKSPLQNAIQIQYCKVFRTGTVRGCLPWFWASTVFPANSISLSNSSWNCLSSTRHATGQARPRLSS